MLFSVVLFGFSLPPSLTSCLGRCTCYTENKDYERGKEDAVIAAVGGGLEPNKTTERGPIAFHPYYLTEFATFHSNLCPDWSNLFQNKSSSI
jgi:hypothetical protein